jgi:hypothetical protein
VDRAGETRTDYEAGPRSMKKKLQTRVAMFLSDSGVDNCHLIVADISEEQLPAAFG